MHDYNEETLHTWLMALLIAQLQRNQLKGKLIICLHINSHSFGISKHNHTGETRWNEQTFIQIQNFLIFQEKKNFIK